MKTFKDLKLLFETKDRPGFYFKKMNNGYSLQIYESLDEGNIFDENNIPVAKFMFLEGCCRVPKVQDGIVRYGDSKDYEMNDSLKNLEDVLDIEIVEAIISM